jgi:hypothetical protein
MGENSPNLVTLVLGYILGDFFHKLIRSPCWRQGFLGALDVGAISETNLVSVI